MTRQYFSRYSFTAILLMFLISSCSGIGAGVAGTSGGSQIWLDKPRDGSNLNMAQAPFEVLSHYNNLSGIDSVVFSVNGESLGTAGAGETFGELFFGWSPTVPGSYLLRVEFACDGGSCPSDSVEVFVEGQRPAAEPVEQATDLPPGADTPTPTFTATFTPTAALPTETSTVTPIATATVVQSGSISGVVYQDNDGNGSQGGPEPGLGGVTVNLVSGGGCAGIAITTSTDGSGSFSFAGVSPGPKCISVQTGTLPSALGWDPTEPDFPEGNNPFYQITLGSGENRTLNFGFEEVVGGS